MTFLLPNSYLNLTPEISSAGAGAGAGAGVGYQARQAESMIMGGKSMKRRLQKSKTLRTGIRGRGKYIKGWSKQQPGAHQRTMMMKQCGKKCFLGPRKTFPICSKNTCKRNKKGVYAAYIRAREYMTIKPNSQKYRRITSKARRILKK